jgi:hypothetical protein
MTFSLKCPNCGHNLGYGHHSDDVHGEEHTHIQFTAKSDPRVKPKQTNSETHSHEGGKK